MARGIGAVREAGAAQVVQGLLVLARCMVSRQVTMSKRGPRVRKPKGWVEGSKASAHVSTAWVLKTPKEQRP